MPDWIAEVMDPRLADLLARWRALPAAAVATPLAALADHADHLLVIAADGPSYRYTHYGRAFVAHFGIDLTDRVIDVVPADILPTERRGMLEFEYAFARRTQSTLWRSYTAEFGTGVETWQRLVLPAGPDRLVVGAYPVKPAAALSDEARLLGLVIDRVPVVLDDDGLVADLALSLKTFTDTHRQIAELEVLASRDELTGVANLRHFHRQAGLERDHARLMGRSFALLALDIDHFKRINDRFGHAAGDAALKAFAEACRLALREGDILGRVGGEEFAVALPNTGLDGARIIAERLRAQVEALSVPLPDKTALAFTVSVGVAACTFAGTEAEPPTVTDLLARADKALYRAKETGRNRVVAAPG
ncbi:MAG: GGDEF domain-containing protein [Actinomycetota bacterium]